MYHSIKGVFQIIIIFMAVFLLAAPAAALYDFEGIPLGVVAQGEVRGEVVTAGTYGIANPPAEVSLSLDSDPVWAGVYTGVWGGTEKYTGRVDLSVNGEKRSTTLYGVDDKNEDVAATSHGTYWVSYDATDLLKKGENKVAINTSRGEPGNRLDGRIYNVLVVAVLENDSMPLVRYQLATGNENLHGEGWSGDNPTKKDEASVILRGAGEGVSSASLTTVLLATNRGQPDYILFNGRDLGTPATPEGDYLNGAFDIGNERSYDADGGEGTESRYFDIESFDVTADVREENEITFQRGRDLDGDGTISTTGATPEGEDYIHPCFALLTLEMEKGEAAPEFSVRNLRITGASVGSTAEITADLENTGYLTDKALEVIFAVDGTEIQRETVTPSPSGIQKITADWQAMEGQHTISAKVLFQGREVGSDLKVNVGTAPDLSVKVRNPVRAGETPASPVSTIAVIAGLATAGILVRRSPGMKCLFGLVLVASVVIGSSFMVMPTDAGVYLSYDLPIEVTNSGGSDAPAFDLTIWLDGEKAVVKAFPEGVGAGESAVAAIPLSTTPGEHTLLVVADEKGTTGDQNTKNNRLEADYEFP